MKTLRHSQQPVDIVIFLDATASMDWVAHLIAENVCRFAEALRAQHLDWRLALYVFRDLKEDEPPEFHSFTKDADQFQRWVNDVEIDGGGGNGGESSIDAMFDGLARCDFRDRAARVFLVFTDEPPHEPDERGRLMSDLIDRLLAAGVVTYVTSPPVDCLCALARSNGGYHFDIAQTRGGFRRLLLGMGTSVSDLSVDGTALREAALAAMIKSRLQALIDDDSPAAEDSSEEAESGGD